MPIAECLVCGAGFVSEWGPPPPCASCGSSDVVTVDMRRSRGVAGPVFRAGDHAALLYASERRFMEVVVPFVRTGLDSGETVLLTIEPKLRDAVLESLDLDRRERAHVGWSDPREHYGSDFNAERTCRAYAEIMEHTPGPLRVAAALDRESAEAVDPEECAHYEQVVEGLLQGDALALCAYDARHCSRKLLDVATAHDCLAGRHTLHERY